MKTILLSLLLMISTATHAEVYGATPTMKEYVTDRAVIIHKKCIDASGVKDNIVKAKALALQEYKVIITTTIASIYVYRLCMVGNFDIELNNIEVYIKNKGVKI